jgi:hypothetical protein
MFFLIFADFTKNKPEKFFPTQITSQTDCPVNISDTAIRPAEQSEAPAKHPVL